MHDTPLRKSWPCPGCSGDLAAVGIYQVDRHLTGWKLWQPRDQVWDIWAETTDKTEEATLQCAVCGATFDKALAEQIWEELEQTWAR